MAQNSEISTLWPRVNRMSTDEMSRIIHNKESEIIIFFSEKIHGRRFELFKGQDCLRWSRNEGDVYTRKAQ